MLIMLIGFATRILYAMKVGYDCSTHDLGTISTAAEIRRGHLAYMQYLYEHRSFPAEYAGQFYHPPLFYIAGALILAICGGIKNYAAAFEAVQMMNMLMSCIATWFAYQIMKKMCRDQKFLIIATIFITFCPAFYIIGAELNNDCFVTTFQIMAIYCTIQWMEKQTIPNILKIAVCIVAALLSKTSGGLIAVAIGGCFLYCMIQNRTEWKKYVIQYLIFGIFCVPAGLSWCIYHKVLFDIPFTYVPSMTPDNQQYVGNVAAWKRLLFPYHMKLNYGSINFDNPSYHSNVWTQMFYTMNYDEGLILTEGKLLARRLYQLLFYTSIVEHLILFVITVRNLFSKQVEHKYRILITANYFVIMIMFVQFAFSYPYICTMNFRYIVATEILLMAGYGLYCNRAAKNALLHKVMMGLVSLQSILSVILYLGYSKI